MEKRQVSPPFATVFYGLLILGSCVLLREAWQIDGALLLNGAGTFPIIACGVMILCAFFIAIREWPRKEQADLSVSIPKRLEQLISWPMLGYICVCVAYVVSLEFIGFWPSSSSFLLVSFLALHKRGVLVSAAATAASLAFVFIVFSFIFKVYLP